MNDMSVLITREGHIIILPIPVKHDRMTRNRVSMYVLPELSVRAFRDAESPIATPMLDRREFEANECRINGAPIWIFLECGVDTEEILRRASERARIDIYPSMDVMELKRLKLRHEELWRDYRRVTDENMRLQQQLVEAQSVPKG